MYLAAAVEATNTIDPTVLSVLSIFGGVALTVIAGFIGALIQGRREHFKWQRDQRLKAYGNFLSATDNYLGAALRGQEAELPTVTRESLTASALVHLLGPDGVYEAAAKFQEATKLSIQAYDSGSQVLDQREDERLAYRSAFIRLARKQVNFKG